MATPAVLVISDQQNVLDRLQRRLAGCGCQVLTAATGARGVELAHSLIPDVVVLGLSRQSGDPLAICRRIQQKIPPDQYPITVMAPHADKSAPLYELSGSDDAISPDNLASGIMTILGCDEECSPSVIAIDGLDIDRRRHVVTLDGRRLELTLTEFRIVALLAEQPGFVVSRQRLLDMCRHGDSPTQQRTVDVHIKSIRHKLGERAGLIKTVRGIGYLFEESQSTSKQL